MLNFYRSMVILVCSIPLLIQAIEQTEIEEIVFCQTKHPDITSNLKCLDSVLLKFDRQVTTWENNIEFMLQEYSQGSGSGEALLTFKKASRQFQSFRDVNCRWPYQVRLPDVNAAAVEFKKCKIYMARDRVIQLTLMSKMDL